MSKLKHGLNYIYANTVLRSIAFSLFSIFIPIYLLEQGYSFQSVIIYYAIIVTSTFLSAPISLLLSKKIGYKPLIISDSFLMILFLLLLTNISRLNISIYFLACLFGIKEAFYFIPFNIYFIKSGNEKKFGSQFSRYLVIGQALSLAGPLIGGFIGYFFGFSYLFYSSLGIFILANIPLFLMKNIKIGKKFSLRGVFSLFSSNKKFFFGTIAQSIINSSEGIVWPIFIYFRLKNLISVGSVGILIGIGTILFTFFIGKISDNTKIKYNFIRNCAFVYMFFWVLRIFISNPLFLYPVSLFAGFLSIGLEIPFQTLYYSRASKNYNSEEFIIFREIPLYLGRVILLGVMILVIDKFVVAFSLAIISCLFLALINIKQK